MVNTEPAAIVIAPLTVSVYVELVADCCSTLTPAPMYSVAPVLTVSLCGNTYRRLAVVPVPIGLRFNTDPFTTSVLKMSMSLNRTLSAPVPPSSAPDNRVTLADWILIGRSNASFDRSPPLKMQPAFRLSELYPNVLPEATRRPPLLTIRLVVHPPVCVNAALVAFNVPFTISCADE